MKSYKKTVSACFVGYIVQAIVNNFVPLLFVTFQKSYDIPLSKITLLITFNFAVQLTVDVLSAFFVDKIGYRACAVSAHVLSAAGLVLLTVLPELFGDPFVGILLSVCVYAVGGGLLEVLISPIVEACPTENKEKAMSLLHSFYCWGHMGVVLISTGFFVLFGLENWKILALVWAVVPVCNAVLFTKVPLYSLSQDGEKGLSIGELFSKKLFWVLMLMMVCSGASEQAVSQWDSTFAEQGLGVSKTVGDLMGPTAFAGMMGLSRLIFGKFGEKLDLDRFMSLSCALCLLSYFCISFVPSPIFSLLGCAICGFSVGILWPGTFSKAAVGFKNGGTALFALLALAGDVGCSAGPTLAGFVSSSMSGNLKAGILVSGVFPLLLLAGLFASKRIIKKQ